MSPDKVDLREFLEEIVAYMDNRLDVDQPEPGVQIMNEEGHLYVKAKSLLESLGAASMEEVKS